MSDVSQAPSFAERMNHTVDWVVFSLGVLSLSIALGATVLGSATQMQSKAPTQTEARQIAL